MFCVFRAVLSFFFNGPVYHVSLKLDLSTMFAAFFFHLIYLYSHFMNANRVDCLLKWYLGSDHGISLYNRDIDKGQSVVADNYSI